LKKRAKGPGSKSSDLSVKGGGKEKKEGEGGLEKGFRLPRFPEKKEENDRPFRVYGRPASLRWGEKKGRRKKEDTVFSMIVSGRGKKGKRRRRREKKKRGNGSTTAIGHIGGYEKEKRKKGRGTSASMIIFPGLGQVKRKKKKKGGKRQYHQKKEKEPSSLSS